MLKKNKADEGFSAKWAPAKKSSDKSFGLIFAGLFIIIGLFPLLGDGAVRLWSVAVSGVFLGLSFIAPGVLAPLHTAWLIFGNLLHAIVSPVIIGLIFFLVVTPIGVGMRLISGAPLKLRFDKDAHSYWIKRDPPGPEPDSMRNQF